MNPIINKAIIAYLETLDTSTLIDIHNTYCDENNDPDSTIYGNDEGFFETLFHNNPYEVARSTFYGTYNFSEDYVRFDWYGNLETLSSFTTEDFTESVTRIAKAIESDPSYYNIDLDDTLDYAGLDDLLESNRTTTLDDAIQKYIEANPDTTLSDLEEAIEIYSIS